MPVALGRAIRMNDVAAHFRAHSDQIHTAIVAGAAKGAVVKGVGHFQSGPAHVIAIGTLLELSTRVTDFNPASRHFLLARAISSMV